ncbi:MAG: hypothetical protein AABZ08_03685 [Planctomycetota bacterium]
MILDQSYEEFEIGQREFGNHLQICSSSSKKNEVILVERKPPTKEVANYLDGRPRVPIGMSEVGVARIVAPLGFSQSAAQLADFLHDGENKLHLLPRLRGENSLVNFRFLHIDFPPVLLFREFLGGHLYPLVCERDGGFARILPKEGHRSAAHQGHQLQE